MDFLLGGGRWIRTIEGIASRFTVCPGRIRTPDLLITNQLLYRLSYTSVSVQPAYNSKYRPICQ